MAVRPTGKACRRRSSARDRTPPECSSSGRSSSPNARRQAVVPFPSKYRCLPEVPEPVNTQPVRQFLLGNATPEVEFLLGRGLVPIGCVRLCLCVSVCLGVCVSHNMSSPPALHVFHLSLTRSSPALLKHTIIFGAEFPQQSQRTQISATPTDPFVQRTPLPPLLPSNLEFDSLSLPQHA